MKKFDDPLLTLTLGEAWKQIVYTVSCADRNCWRQNRVDLKALAEGLGPDFPLRDLRKRLACKECGGKDIRIATVDKSTTAATEAMHRWPFDYD